MQQPGSGVHAVILAQGGRINLRPLTDHLPTALLPLAGTPLLDHQIQCLRRLGVDRITVVGGYRSAQLEQACRFYPEVTFQPTGESLRRPPVARGLQQVDWEEAPALILRGDLDLDPEPLRELLEAGETAFWESDRHEAGGLVFLAEEAVEALRESLDRAGEDEPIDWVRRTLEEEFALNGASGGDSILLSSMEALAAALRRHEARREQPARHGVLALPDSPAPSPAADDDQPPPLLYKTLPH